MKAIQLRISVPRLSKKITSHANAPPCGLFIMVCIAQWGVLVHGIGISSRCDDIHRHTAAEQVPFAVLAALAADSIVVHISVAGA